MISDKQITTLVRSGVALATFGVILMAAFAISELKTMSYIGEADKQISSISVNGDGDASAVPDMASVAFAIRAEDKLQKIAANEVNTKMKSLIEALKLAGLKESDIKTESYNLNPQYDYISQVCPPQTIVSQPCIPGKQQLRGYEVSQRVRISIKGKENFEKASDFVDIVSKNGATDLSELQFTVEKPEKVQAEAREEAIKEAKAKAEKLADQLGVELVRIVGFYEGGNQPVYSERVMYSKSMDVAVNAPPTLPVGENQYRSNVTITYEIAE